MSATTEPTTYTPDWLRRVLAQPGQPPRPPRARTLDHQPGEHPMTFSFGARGKDRAAIKADIAAKMAEVVKDQPAHSADEPLVNEVAGKYVDFTAEPGPDEELTASIHGGIYRETARGVRSANLGVSVSITAASVSTATSVTAP